MIGPVNKFGRNKQYPKKFIKSNFTEKQHRAIQVRKTLIYIIVCMLMTYCSLMSEANGTSFFTKILHWSIYYVFCIKKVKPTVDMNYNKLNLLKIS